MRLFVGTQIVGENAILA